MPSCWPAPANRKGWSDSCEPRRAICPGGACRASIGRIASVGASVGKAKCSWKVCLCQVEVGWPRNSGVPVAVKNEVVHQIRRYGIGVIQLRNNPGLNALPVIDRTDRAGEAGLCSGIAADAEVDLLFVVDAVVEATGDEVLRIDARRGGAEGYCAGRVYTELGAGVPVDVCPGERLSTATKMTAAVLQRKFPFVTGTARPTPGAEL